MNKTKQDRKKKKYEPEDKPVLESGQIPEEKPETEVEVEIPLSPANIIIDQFFEKNVENEEIKTEIKEQALLELKFSEKPEKETDVPKSPGKSLGDVEQNKEKLNGNDEKRKKKKRGNEKKQPNDKKAAPALASKIDAKIPTWKLKIMEKERLDKEKA